MHKITLVCSAHRENGLCNAAELLKLLRTIEPDVVFQELRPSDLDSNWSLEVQTIAKYRESKLFQRVAVDRYDMPANLFADTERVFDCVEQTSEEYLVLKEENDSRVRRYGFEYLNSAAFAATMARISEIEEETISRTRDQSLIRGLERWRLAIQRREHEMIRNIYEYCRENVFHTGVFLVGAAHKTGIVKEIGQYAGPETDLISWNFAYDRPISLGAT